MAFPTPTFIDREALASIVGRLLVRSDDLITIADAARMRGCSVQNFSQLVSKGRLRVFTTLGKRLLRRSDVIDYNRRYPLNPRKINRRGKARPRRADRMRGLPPLPDESEPIEQ